MKLKQWIPLIIAGSLAARAHAQGNVVTWIYDDPQADAAATAIAASYATANGFTSIGTQIQNGSIDVMVADFGEGYNGASLPAGTIGPNPTIFVPNTTDPVAIGTVAVHEGTHIVNNHPLPPAPGAPYTPEAFAELLQEQACTEAAANCAAAQALQAHSASNTVSCGAVEKLQEDAGWESLWCSSGMGTFGPPESEPCQGVVFEEIPCVTGG